MEPAQHSRAPGTIAITVADTSRITQTHLCSKHAKLSWSNCQDSEATHAESRPRPPSRRAAGGAIGGRHPPADRGAVAPPRPAHPVDPSVVGEPAGKPLHGDRGL